MRKLDLTICLASVAVLVLLFSADPAQAVPSFATQTGQPCSACHIGAFGPQLTPFGRAFKIGGYTLQGGDGLASKIPLSAMVLGSFNNTASSLPPGSVAQHYGPNNNLVLDQISVFLAGRVSDHTGGFVQATYSDINNTFHLDQVDIRPYTTTFTVAGNELRVGSTINNAPTVTDPFPTTFAWGYPYVASGIVPTPTAQPVLANGFAGNSLGVTAYAWYNQSLYLEGGGYQTLSPYTLGRIGDNYGVGKSQGVAPYMRAAYEWQWNNQDAYVGALFLQAGVYPLAGSRMADPSHGADQYTDLGVDAGYNFFGDGTNTISVYGIYVNEQQNLRGTAGGGNAANGTTNGSHYVLNQIRTEMSYWYKNTYGATLGWQRTWGPADPVQFAAAPVVGSANGKPNSNAFILEADWVPFGKSDSLWSPWANLKLGVQYTAYTQFNGAAKNYDGFGRNASGNNTLYVFSWLAF
ncbi:MAG: hypothetical protein POG24_07655 [Acidocella sp.]|nr:hypothetical protein [Acidocella sp.]